MTGADAGHVGRPGGARQVALLASPSPAFVIAMFGAWAAGYGVLPLPVDFPDRRLRALLGDALPHAVIAQRDLAERAVGLASGHRTPAGQRDLRVLVIDDVLAGAAPGGPVRPQAPDAAAFTVYTSGSTGPPKGVLVRHDQLAPLASWSAVTWRPGSWVRMAQTLSLGFDFGLQEIFTAIPAGGALVVPAPDDRRDARRYARFLRRERITVLFTTPSLADQLIAAGEPLPDLRLVLLGGEVLRRQTAAGMRRLAGPGCRVFNGYGPTEATVNCLMYEVPDVPEQQLPEVLPVGSASSSARIDLVDPHGLPTPLGAVGELLVGGPGVVEGYLGRPEASRASFGVDPEDPAGTVYRTGDLAHVDPTAGFVVLGRTDRQSKVRGFRIELAEVESVLRTAPGVTGAVVRMVGDPPRLVAFVTGSAVEREAVRLHLEERLPPSVVPEQQVVLDALPVTPNGKVDEGALVQAALATDPEPLVGPRRSVGEVESAVCQVWGAALSTTTVPPEANVFELGAHSLVVTRVHLQLEHVLRLRFPVHELFEYPRPRDLARHLAARSSDAYLATSQSSSDEG